ncbi:hypothetical protein LBMAG53_33950 [Planctomycetota bacterium]|nr:hypothetical protein LBMAG53_33950 [Planctomycetota bacterium]
MRVPLLSAVIATMLLFSSMAAAGEPAAAVTARPVNETAWIVIATAGHLAQFWTGKPPGYSATVDPATSAVTLTAPGVAAVVVKPEPHCWAAGAYAPVFDRLGAGPAPASSTGDDPFAVLGDLVEPTVSRIAAKAAACGAGLAKAPGDAAAHEAAALVLAVFTLRESAGFLTDVRPGLNRLAAHLAVAQRLRAGAPASGPGLVASAALSVLTGRAVEAAPQLDRIAASNLPRAKSWAAALRLRLTNDWRLVPADQAKSLLVARERFRAKAITVSLSAARREAAVAIDGTTDFFHIGSGAVGTNYSVEDGHVLLLGGLGDELREIGVCAKEVLDQEIGELPALLAILAQPPAGPAGTVLPWTMWADQAERHLCQQWFMAWDFCDRMWGVPEEANKLQELFTQQFAKLPHAPLILARWSGSAEVLRPHVAAMQKMIEIQPQRMPFSAWIWKPEGKLAKDWAMPRAETWFAAKPPPGTLINVGSRLDRLPKADRLAAADTLAILDPVNRDLLFLQVGRLGDHPAVAALEQMLAPLLGFDYQVLGWVARCAQEGAPDRYAKLMEKLCVEDPDEWWNLSSWYRDQKKDDQALEAALKGWKHGLNRVLAANASQWLVMRLHALGRTSEAKKIADGAYEVFSWSGIQTKLVLCEAMGDLAGAEACAKAQAERYGDRGELAKFYGRHPDFAGAKDFRKNAEAELFPNGMKKTVLAEWKGPPTAGILVTSESELSKAAGLKAGAVIVALDGYRVETVDQYQYARTLKDDPLITLIIYQDNAWSELRAKTNEERRLEIDLKALTPPKPAAPKPQPKPEQPVF